MAENRLVRYWLAQGPGQTVPSIMGKSPQDVKAILGQRELRGMESGRGPSRDYRPGTVSRQDPSPNAPIPEDGLVRYWLAQGPAQTVPSIIDRKSDGQGKRVDLGGRRSIEK